MSNDTNQRRVTMTAHRTRTNRPAYFDEYRAAFERLAPDVQNDVLVEVEAATPPPSRSDYRPSIDRVIRQQERDAALVRATAKRATPVPRTDWRDGTDEGWGE